jgi:hypothetical protein
MIEINGKIAGVKHTQEEDLEYWQGLDVRGRELEYRSKRLHIKKKLDDEGHIIEMFINGELAYCEKKFYAKNDKLVDV